MTSSEPSTVPARERTREAIRTEAARMFAECGYAATGVRDIARAASVDPAIVIRTFGSKEGLFLETMTRPAVWRDVVDGPVETIGFRLLEILLEDRPRGLQVYAALIRASDRPEVADKITSSMMEDLVEPIARRIPSDDAEMRAHLFAAQVQGLMSVIGVAKDPWIASAPKDVLVRHYGALLQRTLTGDF